MAKRLNRIVFLERLDRIKHESTDDRPLEAVDQLGMAGALLALADLDHEHQYNLCRSVAEHLLGDLPEPDDVDLEEA